MSRREWTEKEIDFLFDNYEEMTVKELAEEIDRPIASIQSKCRQLWIKPKSAEREYTMYRGEEVEATGTTREIAEKTGLKVTTIRNYATKGKRGNVTFVEM